MGKIGYLLKRIKTMDKKAMFDKIDSIHKKTGKSKTYLLYDMFKCARKYGAGYMDYDLFEMYNLTPEQRDTYITRGRNNELVGKYNNKDYFHIFENKDEFNTLFKDYIKRDWIKVNGLPKEDVIAFMKKHNEFMAKPVDGGCGHGIVKININEEKYGDKSFNEALKSNYDSLGIKNTDNNKDNVLEALYNKLVENGNNFELEEVIKQHPEVNKIYSGAINTVRVVTILKDNVPHVICAYFRIGNGKFVDNFNSGGMVAPVNEVTGEVMDKAVDKNKNLYETHPQTGTQIKGFKFPDWDKAIAMCKEASKIVPQMGYIGWDVCFTPNGPIFVEGNEFPGHDIYQLPEHTPNKIGMMPKFNI